VKSFIDELGRVCIPMSEEEATYWLESPAPYKNKDESLLVMNPRSDVGLNYVMPRAGEITILGSVNMIEAYQQEINRITSEAWVYGSSIYRSTFSGV